VSLYQHRTCCNQWHSLRGALERRDPVTWSSSSPDFKPLDLFLWGRARM
jgi:hypothetical protein